MSLGSQGTWGGGVCVSLLLAPYRGAYTQWVLSVHFSSHVEFNLTPGKKKRNAYLKESVKHGG